MKEFSSILDEGLKVGLRRVEYSSSNSKALTVLQNARSLGEDGVQPIEPLTTPTGLSWDPGITLSVAHPFPQIFRGKGVTLVADETAIYTVDESTWHPTLVPLYEPYASGTPVLTNAYFTGNANSWTLGTGWAYSGNSITHTAGSAGSVTQIVADQASPLITSAIYDVTVSVKVDEATKLLTGTGIRINMGTGNHSLYFNASGRYRIMMAATGTLDFSIDASAGFQGQIDFIHLRRLATSTITAGGAWHFLDMNTNWMLFNGNCIVGAYVKGYARVFKSITVKTGCYHRGRALLGGFASDYFAQGTTVAAEEGWPTVYDYLNTKTVDGIAYDGAVWERNSQGKNFVNWSSIGGGDVWSTFYPQFALYGYYGVTESLFGTFVGGEDLLSRSHEQWLDLMQRNEAGMMPMTFRGEVKLMKELGKNAVVYGEDGICAMIFATEPIATYGLKEISRIGVAARSSVGGDDKQHLIMDNRGTLWYLGEDLKIKLLGYKEFFSTWPGDNIVISYEEELDLFWLSNGTEAYTWSTYGGLSGPHKQIPVSVNYVDGGSVGFYSTSVIVTDVEVGTDVWDAGLRAVKMVQAIEVGAYLDATTLAAGGLYVAIDYRYTVGDTWSTSSWIPCNAQGVATIQLCGTEFRFYIKCLWDSTKVFPSQKINSLTVRWKLNDKRSIRGIYAAKG